MSPELESMSIHSEVRKIIKQMPVPFAEGFTKVGLSSIRTGHSVFVTVTNTVQKVKQVVPQEEDRRVSSFLVHDQERGWWRVVCDGYRPLARMPLASDVCVWALSIFVGIQACAGQEWV